MKKILLFMIMFFSLSIQTYAKEVNFMQVTDVHFNSANSDALVQFVEDTNKELKGSLKNLDFIVFTGDNINIASPQDLWLFLNVVRKLNIKTYIIPGNHDLRHDQSMSSKNYMYAVRKRMGWYHSSKPNYVFKVNGVVFVTMCGVKEYMPGPNGNYKHEELVWLDKQLTKYSKNKVVILQHFPLIDTKTTTANLYDKEPYYEVLNKHNNVIAIVSGHYHSNREEMVGNVYNIVTAKFNANENYKIIKIDDNYFVSTSLINNSEFSN